MAPAFEMAFSIDTVPGLASWAGPDASNTIPNAAKTATATVQYWALGHDDASEGVLKTSVFGWCGRRPNRSDPAYRKCHSFHPKPSFRILGIET